MKSSKREDEEEDIEKYINDRKKKFPRNSNLLPASKEEALSEYLTQESIPVINANKTRISKRIAKKASLAKQLELIEYKSNLCYIKSCIEFIVTEDFFTSINTHGRD